MEERNTMLAEVLTNNIDKLIILLANGFFSKKNGSITIHFDNIGKIRKIEKHDVVTLV